MTVPARLAKIRFIAQELELALLIARSLPEDHSRRVLARRVAVRAKDFVDHARQLRKPLQLLGVDTGDFHARKEAYAQSFLEHFPVLRDRLGAHMQDVELQERLQLWSEIEVVKLSYFVDGAREIYAHALGPLNLPGYADYASFPEMTGGDLRAALEELCRATREPPGVRMTVDALAGTRPDSLVMLNEHPAHVRAKQIVSLIEWASMENQLCGALERFPNAYRMVKGQLVTDVVSLADCLFTRPVPAGSRQEMKGLDDLLHESNENVWPLGAFKKAFRFEAALAEFRPARNVIGGHLDDDPSTSLQALLAALDSVSYVDVLRLFDKLQAVFEAVCREVIWLGSYLHHNERIHGVQAVVGQQEFVKPFDTASPTGQVGSRLSPDFSVQALTAQLDVWIRGDQGAEDARHLFWEAFLQGPVAEQSERHGVSVGLREAHFLVLRRFESASRAERLRVLELIVGCRTGSPLALVELLLRALDFLAERGDHTLDGEMLDSLSRLQVDYDEPVASVLAGAIRIADAQVAETAAAGLFAFLARAKGGPARRDPPQRQVFAAHVEPLMASMPWLSRMLILLRCASGFADGRVSGSDLVADYAYLQDAIRRGIGEALGAVDLERAQQFSRAHDYVSLSVFLADRLAAQARDEEAQRLRRAVVGGEIGMTRDHRVSGTALANYAIALLRTGDPEKAKAVAARATRMNPHAVDLKISCIQILADAGVSPQECLEMFDYVRRMYVLSPAEEARVAGAERELRLCATAAPGAA